MTLVNADTGELVAELTPDEARAMTDRIKVGMEAVWQLVAEAYQRRAWAALGYSSWDDYCTREFGSSRIRLPREERQEVVGSLREAGLSTRAIAAATGLSRTTVKRDMAQVGQIDPPANTAEEVDDVPPTITGTDGKTYPKRTRSKDTVDKAQALADEGYSRTQIANKLNITKDYVSNLVSQGRLSVPADAAVGRARTHKSDRIVSESVDTLEGVALGLSLADPADIDPDQARDWVTSMRSSLRTINAFVKEMTQ